MEMQTLACNNNWLEAQAGLGQTQTIATTCSNGGTGLVGGTTYLYHSWPYPYWSYPVASSPARPIKLKLSEIERLRKAARADKSLKAILAKFTDQIEIEVDFE